MIDVVVAGLETSVQDFPGRIGFWNQGFPPSGPFDSWSFRLANLLVGNPVGAAGLECQYVGPTLKFTQAAVIAVTGADMTATLDGTPVPLWQSVAVKADQVLKMGPAKSATRAYIAVAGGIDTVPWLGSRSTFHKAGVGGLAGSALKKGSQIPVAYAAGTPGRSVKPECRPEFSSNKQWQIEVVPGPDDDWIDEAGQARFLGSDWKLSAKSDRTGFRLDGPQWTFTAKAYDKLPENGSEPSNIIDHGYPLGAINLAGQTPIILVSDGPSMGGFINPYTVPSAAFWKLGQSRPGDVYRFKAVSVDEAQALRRTLDALCSESSLA
jgi:5-oxoprolinase (ATP-hydrolysing) subunit C